ncbi:fungal-specific transcription factor domain-containing protein [Corynascus novoguineensis]|uniref:Fungal-specific transcription factor domain-containing protein n=1 Tax=Corynascus novoguineensis TaxID=1126955 RepID=A0AAN7HT45_9PEZI|nr:fungal-specific transcription factor domain-containing protein [Corynascus novoguineensis]
MSTSSGTPPDTIMVSEPSAERLADGDRITIEAPAGGNSSVPKPKRLACMICRKRKLKCDGIKPSCSTCSRLGHNCAYDEVRRKSGPKRGYVKALEERLKQVETLLKTQEISSSSDGAKGIPLPLDGTAKPPLNQHTAATANFNVTDPSIGIASGRDMDRWNFNAADSPNNPPLEDFNFNGGMNMGMGGVDNNFTWEMIGLGLEEPLPPQETIDELHQIYFEKIHPSLPMIHKYRYLAAMNLAPAQRPPVCLRYAMWTLACSVSDKFQTLKDLFYARARKYLESDYIKGYGEHMISVAHAQTHVLLASYEFKWMYFPRAWMSTGSCVRLSQMIGLHRLDGSGLDVKQCLPPPRDWTEREERRRTFWMAFTLDRFASIGTGWPMTIDEKDILTNLPASEEAFELSRPEQTPTLQDAMGPAGAGKLSSFAGVALMACLFGRNLVHLHRPDVDDRDHDLNGEFWKRHRQMDNILLNTSLCLPAHLKLPNGLGNANVVFTNMCIHTSTICLHQAALFKADKNRLPASVSSESKVRCITAANEIASIMRMVSHLDLSAMNPFISFCLYVSARVFVQYLKSRPDDSQTADSLRFLLSAMNALKRRNPLTESFLVQLDVDLEALGARIPKLKSAFPRSSDSPGSPARLPSMLQNHGRKQGIGGGPAYMAYSNQCNYMKVPGDDGNPANGPDIIDIDPNPVAANFSPPEQPTALPNRERSHTGPYLPSHGLVPPPPFPTYGAPHDMDTSSSNELSGPSSSEGQSSGRTPNSSTTGTSDPQRQNLAPPPANGHVNGGSGRNSFETSPVPSHQNLSTMPGATRNDVERDVSAFFGTDPSSYGMPAGVSTALAPDQRFGMSGTGDASGTRGGPSGAVAGGGAGSAGAGGSGNGAAEFAGHATAWADMAGQQGMTPTTEGMFRSIMSMGPMDGMDMGWEPSG